VDNPQPRQPTDKLQRYKDRLSMLRQERSTWLSHWIEISEYIAPRKFRYLTNDRNKGTKKNDKIINNRATLALRTLAAGMMAGITSPARPWFRLLAPEHLKDNSEVQAWLDAVEKVLREVFIKSNIYSVLHASYTILGGYGTPVVYIEETDSVDEGFRAYLWPIGQYCLASSSEGRIDTVYREFSFTVGQLVEEFGYKACSTTVQQRWDLGKYDAWIQVVHVVEPNRQREPGKRDGKNKAIRSAWFEAAGEDGKFLRESGYEEFPCMAPRWEATGEDVYGDCPGMQGLGDTKALQLWERRKAQAIDKVVNPPMKAPMSLKAQRISLMPGDTTYVPDNLNGQNFAPAIEVKPEAVTVAEKTIAEHGYRIDQTFYVDLFRMLEQSDSAPNGGKQPITAREVNERHEEKMLQLGPVLELIHDELLDPMFNRVVQILARKRRLPPPPPMLRGQHIRVEYISIMAQAQKLLGTAAIERLSSFAGSLSAVNKDILDLIDFDKMIREYAEMLGVPAGMMKDEKVVQQLREQRAKAQQQQAMMEQAQQGAATAKDLSGASVEPNNMLGKLLNSGGGGQGMIQ
jgi:hypothetical protein